MRFSILLLVMVLVSCRDKNGRYDGIRIIGHAGTGLSTIYSVYHDNSLECIEYAVDLEGCDGVEIDVQLSASGDLWLYHDTDLSSQTGTSGCIYGKTREELKQVRYTSFHKEKLAALDDLSWKRLKGKTVMLDLRYFDACSQSTLPTAPFIQKIQELWTAGINNDTDLLILVNNFAWSQAFDDAGLSSDVIYCAETYEDAVSALQKIDFKGVMFRNKSISAAQTGYFQNAGKIVIIFEVRSPKGIRSALKKYPDYLVTDNLHATIIEKY